MRSSIYLFVILSILSILTGSLHAANGDMGLSTQPLTDGSADYPYLIEDFDDFDTFAASSAYWVQGIHTSLSTDINLSGRTYKMAPISPDPTSNNLYDFDGIPYAGIFDGNDHTISNLTINSTGTSNDYLGLFGMIADSGSVTNLEISADINADIYSCYNGAVCAVNAGYIENCVTSGILVNNKQDAMAYSNDSTGGICGKNSGSIVSCNSSMVINGNSWYFGSICGYNDIGTISNCYAASSVSGGSNSKYLGGLCGYNDSGTISNCYADSSVSGGSDSNRLGGLCGFNDSGTINNCYATSSVSGYRYLGGLCGYNYSGTFTNCYATGSVSGDDYLGGLCGYNDSGTISNCYFYMFAGPDDGIGIPLDDTQLQDKTSFAGFDFYGDSADGTDDIWDITPGFMPRLYWQDALGVEPPMLLDNINTTLNGTGYSNDPFIIYDYDDLMEFRNNSSLRIGYYSLASDIDIAGTTYSEAFIPELFIGDFNGYGHSISNLSINGTSYLGFFSKVSGKVSNLNIEHVNIIASGDCCGGLCGKKFGTITNCYATGSVSGDRLLGGLCGWNYSGTITNSYAAGSVSGDRLLGGLCGYNYRGTITNCYATCSVSGHEYLGGLCGYNDIGTISNCYAASSVLGGDYFGGLCGRNYSGTISNCYFYMFAGPDDGIGIPLDDTQLQDKTSFAGFDFYGDSADGTDDIWDITPGFMPRLYWQDVPGFEPPYYLDTITTTLSGSGYKDDPFIIDSIDDVNEFCSNAYLVTGYYKLMIDIDCSECYFGKGIFIGEFDGNNHTFTSCSSGLFEEFKGTVKNLVIKDVLITQDYSGVITYENFGSIINCHVSGFIYAPDEYYVGGLVLRNDGSIIDSSFDGFITGHYSVGGIAGLNWGSITNCTTSGNFLGQQILGGLVGDNKGIINKCYSSTTIKGTSSIGGLAGSNSGEISKSFSLGKVFSRENYSGGFVGSNDGVVNNSYSNCTVLGKRYVGGFIGNNTGEVSNCFSVSSVSATIVSAGGMIGRGVGALNNCFWDIEKSNLWSSDINNYGAIGKTTSEMQDINTYLNAGWDFIYEDINGTEDIWGIMDYPVFSWQVDFETMPDLTNLSFNDAGGLLSDHGFAVGNINYDYSDTVTENLVMAQSYPAGSAVALGAAVNLTLSFGATQTLDGSGTVNSPYLINNINDFYIFRKPDNASLYWSEGVYVELACDLDLEGHTFVSAPVSPDNDKTKSFFQGTAYNGVFNGDGHSIGNLTIDPDQLDNDYLGLFGELGTTAIVQNLSLENIIINAGIRSYNIGAICGKNNGGTIQNCYAAGAINCSGGSDYIGGICGYNSNGIIDESYSAVTITGGEYSQFVGGLCGENSYGTITHSFAGGDVSGENNLGGFCGVNSDGIIENCYATGNTSGKGDSSSIGGFCGFNDYSGIYACYSTGIVSSEIGTDLIGGFCGDSYESMTESCFWDMQTSGQSSSFGGTGCTTIQMQNINTYVDAGWDISADSAAKWYLPSGFYPVLARQGCVAIPEELEITLPEGSHAIIDLNLVSVSSQPVNWSIDTNPDCPWGVSTLPSSGTFSGLGESQYITVNIEPGMLPLGIHKYDLIVSLDEATDIIIPVKLNIVDTVNMEDFAVLSQYWLATGCDQSLPCSAADFNDDTVVDILDLTEFTNQWLLYNNIDNSFSEDFEDINLQASDFQFINSMWVVFSYMPYEGSFCLMSSGSMREPQRSIIYIDLDTTFCDNISFAVKTSSEKLWDSLNFYIDDCLQGQWSGNMDWQLVSFPVTDGVHTFKWEFSQDYEDGYNYDENNQRIYHRVWIDDIKIQ